MVEEEHRTIEMTVTTVNQLFDEDYYLFILKNAIAIHKL
jgi:hypothetical protein